MSLGENEQAYHESIADQILPMKLEGILLYGERMKWLYDELQKCALFGQRTTIVRLRM